MDETGLLRFLLDASRRGYAAGRGAVKVREADHSTTIVHERGEWKFQDNYFGGEPYGGRSVVFLDGRPVWMAVYYGWVENARGGVDIVYSFLQGALLQAPTEFPVRGPDEFSEGHFVYRNVHHGGVANFSGEETIHEHERLVYTARYAGGLVDQRAGD
jgi:uncharacterized protein DUF5680